MLNLNFVLKHFCLIDSLKQSQTFGYEIDFSLRNFSSINKKNIPEVLRQEVRLEHWN